MELMFRPFARYADFNGRARRSEYWLWALFMFIAVVLYYIVQLAVFGGSATSSTTMQNSSGATIAASIYLLFSLITLIPSTAVAVRRMHDTNRTGWWIIFPNVVYTLALIVYISTNGSNFMTQVHGLAGGSGNPETFVPALVGVLTAPWVLYPAMAAKIVTFVFRVLDGTPGNNRFGPDPKGRGAVKAAVF